MEKGMVFIDPGAVSNFFCPEIETFNPETSTILQNLAAFVVRTSNASSSLLLMVPVSATKKCGIWKTYKCSLGQICCTWGHCFQKVKVERMKTWENGKSLWNIINAKYILRAKRNILGKKFIKDHYTKVLPTNKKKSVFWVLDICISFGPGHLELSVYLRLVLYFFLVLEPLDEASCSHLS